MSSAFSFTSRQWPGWSRWTISFLSAVAIFEFLALLAWKNEQGRFFDVTAAFVGIPCAACAFLVATAIIWTLAGKGSFVGAMGWSVRILPFTWAIPIFDLIRTYGNGLAIAPPALNGVQFFIAVVSGGALPLNSGISIGIRLGMIAGAIGTALVAWHVSKKIWAGLLGGWVFSGLALKLLSPAPFLALWGAWFDRAGWWNVSHVEIMRKATLVLSRGYWWADPYGRFLSGVDAQSDIVFRLFTSAQAVLILACFFVIAFFLFAPARTALLRRVIWSWGSAEALLYTFVGFAFGWSLRASQTGGSSAMIAVALFIVLLLGLRIHSVFRRDLANLEQDERLSVPQPLTRGDMSFDTADAMSRTALCIAAASAWVLGWPIFFCAAAYVALANLVRDRFWSPHAWAVFVFKILGGASFACLAFFFLTQSAKITISLPLILLTILLYRVTIDLFWMPRIRKSRGRIE